MPPKKYIHIKIAKLFKFEFHVGKTNHQNYSIPLFCSTAAR